ncbi:hypothetical protein HHE02_10440 [Helicobacter heilmannii]|uniref:Uncharacterized protein n=1 Tax=Helicobacter heilmannii TaxID=35817 RepID=A0A0K2XHZ2_HELHE|nr:hypothetical protein [Helicobacter heilmannii]CCM10732.1 hypothetical protein BN341_16630 [Helicobacter heilmannii ASB1.4]CRF46113.1 hypothetical protein HHE014_11030 [Helicobacter heilmannii]CRF47749.1 hypothetical protein HHE02_10440 [Helicobacter heilmannii]CRF49234.1 hypothetical protein HHE03_08330 [Helicobacter heilmannii]CRI35234.1 hypothetical protein HHE01_02320 [Helicobacter heilmannii]
MKKVRFNRHVWLVPTITFLLFCCVLLLLLVYTFSSTQSVFSAIDTVKKSPTNAKELRQELSKTMRIMQ